MSSDLAMPVLQVNFSFTPKFCHYFSNFPALMIQFNKNQILENSLLSYGTFGKTAKPHGF